MKITVITVCFNSEETIEDTIQSVLAQEYDNIEYVIVDGGSTDSTRAIIGKYKGRIAKVISEPDRGMWDAMNKGVKYSSGEYIAFLNSDDVFSSECSLRKISNKLVDNCIDAAFSYVDIVRCNDLNVVKRRYRVKTLCRGLLRMGIMPAHPAFTCKRVFFERFGGFMLDEKVSPDFELMVRFFMKGELRASLVPEVLVKMRDGGLSNSGWRYRLDRFRRQVYSCRINGLWTTPFLVLAKYPYKLLEYLK
jgi:glycosyltransferase involved in cell wall biosynthesis